MLKAILTKLKSLKPSHMRWRDEHGFSLVSILAIVAVVLVAIVMISNSRVSQQRAQKALRNKQSYSDAAQAIIADIAAVMHDSLVAAPPCVALASIQNNFNANAVIDQSTPSYSYTNAIPVPAGSAIHSAAAARCRNPRTPNAGTNRFDFCVRLGRDTTAPKDSILNAEFAFAEVAVELIDSASAQNLTCAEYASFRDQVGPAQNLSAGLALTIAFYWQSRLSGNQITYSQKVLSYNANLN